VETLFLEGELIHPQVEDGSDGEAEFIHRLKILAAELQKDRQNKKKGKPSVEISQAPAPETLKNTISTQTSHSSHAKSHNRSATAFYLESTSLGTSKA
jgi:hypothetical protein